MNAELHAGNGHARAVDTATIAIVSARPSTPFPALLSQLTGLHAWLRSIGAKVEPLSFPQLSAEIHPVCAPKINELVHRHWRVLLDNEDTFKQLAHHRHVLKTSMADLNAADDHVKAQEIRVETTHAQLELRKKGGKDPAELQREWGIAQMGLHPLDTVASRAKEAHMSLESVLHPKIVALEKKLFPIVDALNASVSKVRGELRRCAQLRSIGPKETNGTPAADSLNGFSHGYAPQNIRVTKTAKQALRNGRHKKGPARPTRGVDVAEILGGQGYQAPQQDREMRLFKKQAASAATGSFCVTSRGIVGNIPGIE